MVDLTIGLITGNPAYGGIEHFGSASLPDINTTPQVVPATSAAVEFPQGVIQDFANNGMVLLFEGVWNITLTISMLFVGVNNARSYAVEFYNATQDNVLAAPIVSVGRNAEGSNPAASLIIDVRPPAVNDLLQMRLVSASDVFTGVDLNFYSFNMIRIDVPRTK